MCYVASSFIFHLQGVLPKTSFLNVFKATIKPRIPITPTVALESAVGTAPPAEDVLVTLLAALETLLTAVLKMDVVAEITSVVKEEMMLPAPVAVPDGVVALFKSANASYKDDGITAVVVITPLVNVLMAVVGLPGLALADDNVVVMVLPIEFVVIMTVVTGIKGPPGAVVARKALMSDSRAAIWVDHASNPNYQ